ncbi:MAG: hypothetical protein AAF216_01850 [Pseudomonadota bacterium]
MDEETLKDYPLFRSIIAQHRGLPSAVTKSKRCFVISPIGAPDSLQRRHADQVMDFIIRPALFETEFEPHRADHAEAPGRISQHMFDSILDDDMLIAVMTFHNPNVFYEIAVAQSAARPLVLLIEEGEDIPFDVKDDRVITYSLNTNSLVDGVSATRLRAAVEHLARQTSQGGPAFRPSATPLNSGLGDTLIHERSSSVTYSNRMDFMRQADHSIDLLGIANLAFGRHPDAASVGASRKDRPLRLRILQVHPDNPGLASLLGGPSESYLNKVREEIRAAADAWHHVEAESQGGLSIELRQMTQLTPTASMMLSDDRSIWTPYFASRSTNESPTIETKSGSVYHGILQREFDHYWASALPIAPA